MTVEPAAEDRAFRCSVGAVDEPMAGSAAVAAAYLLVEHPGPWGRKALAESRFPEHVRHGLAEAADAAGVRVQLIRRPGRSTAGDGLRIFATYADPIAPRTLTAHVNSPEALLVLDLAAVAAGEDAGLVPHDHPLYLVCTNGRRDLCCAELGRPIVAALSAAYPDETWETTTSADTGSPGRWWCSRTACPTAGSMPTPPSGWSRSRVPASSISRTCVAGRRTTGPSRRPRSPSAKASARPASTPSPCSAAHLSRRPRTRRRPPRRPSPPSGGSPRCEDEGAAATEVRFGHARGEVTVRVARVPSPPARQSCADLIAKPGTRYFAT